MKLDDLLDTLDIAETRVELYSLNSNKRIAYTRESLKKYGETTIRIMRLAFKQLAPYSNTIAPCLLVYATDTAIDRAKEAYDKAKEEDHGVQS